LSLTPVDRASIRGVFTQLNPFGGFKRTQLDATERVSISSSAAQASEQPGEIEPTQTSGSQTVEDGLPMPDAQDMVPSEGKMTLPQTVDSLIFQRCVEVREDRIFHEHIVYGHLDKSFSADGMSKEEFNKLLGVDVSKIFWHEITMGKGVIENKDELLEILNHVLDSMSMTGEYSFKALAESKMLLIVAPKTLASGVREMNWRDTMLTEGSEDYNQYIARAFYYAQVSSKDKKVEGFSDLDAKGWEIFTMGLLNHFLKDGGKLIGYDKMNKLLLSDGWTACRFSSILERYYLDKDYMADYLKLNSDFDGLLGSQKDLREFRKWAKKEGVAGRIDAVDFDANAKTHEGEDVLALILNGYKANGIDWVVDTLNMYKTKTVQIVGGSGATSTTDVPSEPIDPGEEDISVSDD